MRPTADNRFVERFETESRTAGSEFREKGGKRSRQRLTCDKTPASVPSTAGTRPRDMEAQSTDHPAHNRHRARSKLSPPRRQSRVGPWMASRMDAGVSVGLNVCMLSSAQRSSLACCASQRPSFRTLSKTSTNCGQRSVCGHSFNNAWMPPRPKAATNRHILRLRCPQVTVRSPKQFRA
jgi:hypothetical protein